MQENSIHLPPSAHSNEIKRPLKQTAFVAFDSDAITGDVKDAAVEKLATRFPFFQQLWGFCEEIQTLTDINHALGVSS